MALVTSATPPPGLGVSMAPINTSDYLLDQAKRRLTPTISNLPGMGVIEKRLLERDWKQKMLAEPPAGSGLKPVMGDSGLPILGHIVESFRGGPDWGLRLYQERGPVFYAESPVLPSIFAVGPEAI